MGKGRGGWGGGLESQNSVHDKVQPVKRKVSRSGFARLFVGVTEVPIPLSETLVRESLPHARADCHTYKCSVYPSLRQLLFGFRDKRI